MPVPRARKYKEALLPPAGIKLGGKKEKDLLSMPVFIPYLRNNNIRI